MKIEPLTIVVIILAGIFFTLFGIGLNNNQSLVIPDNDVELSYKSDKLNEIFNEQHKKMLYHADMQMKHIHSNYPLSKKHLDSLLMSGYVLDVVREKMK